MLAGSVLGLPLLKCKAYNGLCSTILLPPSNLIIRFYFAGQLWGRAVPSTNGKELPQII